MCAHYVMALLQNLRGLHGGSFRVCQALHLASNPQPEIDSSRIISCPGLMATILGDPDIEDSPQHRKLYGRAPHRDLTIYQKYKIRETCETISQGYNRPKMECGKFCRTSDPVSLTNKWHGKKGKRETVAN